VKSKGALSRSALLVLILLLGFAPPAETQSFGRWWWQAQVGIEQWSNENRTADTSLSKYGQLGLRLSGSLNGFVVHPSIASFRLDLDTLFSRFDDSVLSASDDFGGGLELKILPRGGYPLRLGFKSTSFAYGLPPDGDPATLLTRPDRTFEWLGDWQVNRGLFRGLLLAFNRTNIDFLDPEAREGIHEQNLVQWSRTTGKIRHQIRARRRYDLYGTRDFEREDLALYLDERSIQTAPWSWMFTGSGISYTTKSNGREDNVDQFRVFGKAFRPIRRADRIELELNGDSFRTEAEGASLRYGLRGSYRWYPKPHLQVAPFLGYVAQDSDTISFRSPRIGLSVIWNRQGPKLRSVLGFTSNTGQVRTSGTTEDSDQRQTSFALTETLTYGNPRRLLAELELGLSHNELDLRRRPLFDDESDLIRAFERDDTARVRTKLRRIWGPRNLNFWLDWEHMDSSGELQPIPFVSDTFSANLQYTDRKISAIATVGDTSIDRLEGNNQELRFGTASISWRPLYFLRLDAYYRANRQSLILAPSLDTQSVEMRLHVEMGLLIFEARVFEATEEFVDSPSRTNRGFNWSVRRRFGGWLPIVSAPKRRGTIR
jgi:hypothetical protein